MITKKFRKTTISMKKKILIALASSLLVGIIGVGNEQDVLAFGPEDIVQAQSNATRLVKDSELDAERGNFGQALDKLQEALDLYICLDDQDKVTELNQKIAELTEFMLPIQVHPSSSAGFGSVELPTAVVDQLNDDLVTAIASNDKQQFFQILTHIAERFQDSKLTTEIALVGKYAVNARWSTFKDLFDLAVATLQATGNDVTTIQDDTVPILVAKIEEEESNFGRISDRLEATGISMERQQLGDGCWVATAQCLSGANHREPITQESIFAVATTRLPGGVIRTEFSPDQTFNAANRVTGCSDDIAGVVNLLSGQQLLTTTTIRHDHHSELDQLRHLLAKGPVAFLSRAEEMQNHWIVIVDFDDESKTVYYLDPLFGAKEGDHLASIPADSLFTSSESDFSAVSFN